MHFLTGLWKGRSDRREYWLSMFVLVVVGGLTNLVVRSPTIWSFVSLPFWLFIATRRLHDFGASGVWGLVPFGAGFVLGFARSATTAASLQLMPAATQGLIEGGVGIIVMIVVGSVPGTKGKNRYGYRRNAVRPEEVL